MYYRAIWEIIALAMYKKDKFHSASPREITLPSNVLHGSVQLFRSCY